MQNQEAKKATEQEKLATWKAMLLTFDEIISGNPKPEDVKEELNELKEAAKNTHHLTERQLSAIFGRCDNYLNGTYGKDTKKKEYLANS